MNTEILEREDADEYLREKYGIKDKNNVEAKKSIELGHIFQLGTKYTESMNAKYIDQEEMNNYYIWDVMELV